MRHYPKYLVKAEDKFDSFNYPQLEEDIIKINESSIHVSQIYKAEILISFAKNHSLKNDWINANPVFATLVTTGELPINTIVSLFEASAQNSYFQQQLEKFLLAHID